MTSGFEKRIKGHTTIYRNERCRRTKCLHVPPSLTKPIPWTVKPKSNTKIKETVTWWKAFPDSSVHLSSGCRRGHFNYLFTSWRDGKEGSLKWRGRCRMNDWKTDSQKSGGLCLWAEIIEPFYPHCCWQVWHLALLHIPLLLGLKIGVCVCEFHLCT